MGCVQLAQLSYDRNSAVNFLYSLLPSTLLCASINFMMENKPNEHPNAITDFISFEEIHTGIGRKRSTTRRFCRKTDQVQLKAPNVSKTTFLLAW